MNSGKESGCCCPPKGYNGAWGAGPCPVHMGLRGLTVGAAQQVAPCVWCCGLGKVFGLSGEFPNRTSTGPVPCPKCSTAQPVAVEGMPERIEPMLGLDPPYARGWNAYADAVTPLVAKLQSERDAAASVAQERGVALDTYLPLLNEVIGERDALRAEVERLKLGKRTLAELDSATLDQAHRESDTLRTTNAEMVGLLREVVTNPGKVMIPLDLWKRIDALLASAGGGDAQV